MIELPEALYQRLQQRAEPFVDTPATVIERLLDTLPTPPKPASSALGVEEQRNGSTATRRRRLSAVLQLEGVLYQVASVPDMYAKVMAHIDKSGRLDELRAICPIATSRKRYLLSDSFYHPTGVKFVSPVEHKGLYMEGHKSYEAAMAHLQSRILDRLGMRGRLLD